jgi:hypothetical protein
MASMERQFREALAAPDVETASEPAMMGSDDMRCPMCGASAKKIAEASAPPAPEMPMGGDRGMMK